ncbi:hypothetical protein [Polynucleobacter sp. UK-Mo-2m-Kol15]|uniref:hypothetical protein n=1 Tax=Polynucleobacter sp. UK-Mo-2m-Kol15 TaxID=2576916 RepID=UPI001C0D64C1|nr:hypothetical protein [Polynucleobacter sp. UK-Mo-2m-Kol15]MBU3576006.1 hypothetical protein [Polynucleobacter sp. UK-Mo-2m-Kol15]
MNLSPFFLELVLQSGQLSTTANNYLKKRTDAFMTITGYLLTPNVTTGSLSITT